MNLIEMGSRIKYARELRGFTMAELAEKVAALPYDVMDSAEARIMVEGNPYSFLHVDKAEIDLDIISNTFKSGELVNLQSLKQKGLIDENTEYVKILAK